MDSKTRTTLERSGKDTRHIVIYNDVTLSDSDIYAIASKINECTKLESLTISGCDLVYNSSIDVLSDSLANHPSLTKLDLSQNNFSSLEFATKILQGAKKIHTLDLSGNKNSYDPIHYRKFLSVLKSVDTVAKIKLKDDPYMTRSCDWNMNTFQRYFNSGFKNLIEINFDDNMNTDQLILISNLTSHNTREAQNILEKAQSYKTVEEFKALNERLPSVIALAEKKMQRSEIIHILKMLNEKALTDFGMSIGIELYTTESESKGSAVVTAPETPLTKLPTIIEVITGLPALSSEEAIRAQIEEGRSNPIRIMELGHDFVGGVGNISLASLQEATSATSMETPVRSMADFLEKFSGAKAIIEELTRQPESALPVVAERKSFFSRFWNFGTAGQENKELHSLADAGVKAREAGQVLQDMIPSLLGMEERLTGQLSTTHKVIGAYNKVGEQLGLIQTVGSEILAVWRQEAKASTDPLNEPFHVQTLASRLEFLGQVKIQITGHVGRHMLHAAVEQRQQQGVSMLRGQNIPLIAEQVATFMRQVEELQRAGVINSLANATREAARTEQDTNVLAAIKTVEAIENLAGSTQEALTNMGKVAEQISAHIGVLDSSAGLLPPSHPKAAISEKRLDRA